MPGVLAEQPIRLPSDFPDFRRQLAIRRQKRGVARDLTVGRGRVPRLCRLSAQLGPRRRASPERPARPRTGAPSVRRPEASSHWAIRSCSSAGSVASFAMAASSARVITCSIQFASTRPNPAVHRTGARVARPPAAERARLPRHAALRHDARPAPHSAEYGIEESGRRCPRLRSGVCVTDYPSIPFS